MVAGLIFALSRGAWIGALCGYFVVVGVRDADGTLRLIQKPVADEKLIKAAVAAIGKDD